ncbi:MAG: hypothetical protein HC881_24120, partial [Leptolyngbyaceae cyanobacterium SL_7_1]|nr:hypothetical protein [Leptolyngbyaceae cyanobacterium SL_7_1]
MVKNEEISFKLRLTDEEWENDEGGWRCSAMKIPGAEIEEIYAEGKALHSEVYKVDQKQEMILWRSTNTKPKKLTVL